MEKHPESNVVELDTVHGCNKTGNVMLTLLFRNCNFMLIKLMTMQAGMRKEGI